MKLLIDIPDEFVEHYNMDKFKDSFERIIFDIKSGLYDGSIHLSGNYEKELIDVLKESFESAKVDPEITANADVLKRFTWKRMDEEKPIKPGFYWIKYLNPDKGPTTIFKDCLYQQLGDSFKWLIPSNVSQEHVVQWCEMPLENM